MKVCSVSFHMSCFHMFCFLPDPSDSGSEKGSFGKGVFSEKFIFYIILENFFEILEILESPQSVENKGGSDLFLEILENLEILEIPPVKDPFRNDCFWSRNRMGGFRKGSSCNTRFVLKADIAIASEVSISSKNSRFPRKENAANQLLRNSPSWNHRVPQGSAQRGAQFYFMFAVLRTLFFV